jgi:hypothetical protein
MNVQAETAVFQIKEVFKMSGTFFSRDPLAFQEYFISSFTNISGGKYTISPGQKNVDRKKYYEIYETTEMVCWKKCRFHFEISGNKDSAFVDIREANLIAHIEIGDYIKDQAVNMRIRNTFGKEKGDNIIISEPITVNFTSEEATIESIKSIIKILESIEFQNIAETVKKLIHNN